MTRKTLKVVLGLVSVLVLSLTAGVVLASTNATKGQLPEYLGSQACLGCHADKFTAWESSEFSHGNSPNIAHEIKTIADLPADPTGIAPELAAELALAKYYYHGRFMTPDLKTGELKYLGIEYNETTKQYVANPARKGTSMDGNCGGCHAGQAYQTGTRTEIGVGCESCHGPGRDHVLGKGDKSKIVASTDPSITCTSCHSGRNTSTVAGAISYPVGYRPGMKLSDFTSFVPYKADPNGVPEAPHHKGAVPQWAVSGHAGATNLLAERGETYLNRQECIFCHSTNAGMIIAAGQKFDASKDFVNDGVSCVACHDPHGNNNKFSLKMEPKALCNSCHTLERGGAAPAAAIGTTRAPHRPQGDMLVGKKAIGVADTPSFHSELGCNDCHMTDGNHQMKVITPADVMGTKRVDSCSQCHKDSTPEARDAYLKAWQNATAAKLATVKADVTMVEEALKANPNVLGDKKAVFEAARANFWFVEKDKSLGAHNFDYAMKLLNKSQKDIAPLLPLVK